MLLCVATKELAHPNVIPEALIPLDSFVSQEDHYFGREYATRNIQSKGRSMIPPPQIQPR